MKDRTETETKSLIEEQGRRAERTPRDEMADVPVQPTSAGVVMPRGPDEHSTTEEDREAAEKRGQNEPR